MVPDKMGGRGVKCPRCEHAFTAPNGLPTGSHTDLRLPVATTLPPVVAATPPTPAPAPVPIPIPMASVVGESPPLPLAQAITASPAGTARPRPPAPRRRLTRLVLDLPETMLRNVPRPLQGITQLAGLALALGLTAWALTQWAHLEMVGFALAAIGLLLGGVALAALLQRHEKGWGLPAAALLVNVQAFIFAAVGAFAGEVEERPPVVNRPPSPGTAVNRLRQQLKDPDPKERLQGSYALVEMARDLNKSILDLINLLRDPQKEVRAAVAEAVGLLGAEARIAYPSLVESNRADNDETVRAKAQEAMKRVGAPTATDMPTMLETFNDRKLSKQLRANAALALGMIGADARLAAPSLEEGLKDPEAIVRVSCAQALWLLVGKQAEGTVDVLIATLKDFDPVVRARAAYALFRMRGDAKDAAGQLEIALTDSDPQVRRNAAFALWAIGPAARAQVPKLVEALRDSDAKVRLGAAMGLWAIARQKDGIPVLCDLLKASETVVRISAVTYLHDICREARASNLSFKERDAKSGNAALADAVPALIAALSDQSDDVHELAARTLSIIGKDAAAAVRPLTEALKSGDPKFRAEAAYAIGNIGGDAARPAVKGLQEALTDRDNTVRVFAAQALFLIERRGEELVPVLVGVMKDRDPGVRSRAANALGNMGDQARAAVPALNDALKDANPSLKLTAATALGKIGSPAVVAYANLQELAKDDTIPEIKKAASTAMRQIGAPKKSDVQTILIPALSNNNPNYRASAIVCLWMLYRDARSAVGPLSKALSDPDATVRGTAAFALAAIGPEAVEAVPALIKALQSQGDETLRFRAAYALGEIGPKAKEAIEPLKAALDDKKPAVRLHAAQALWSIDPKAEELVPALTRLLDDKELDTNLLVAAVETLSKMGSHSPADAKLLDLVRTKTIPALTRLIGDSDEALQLSAINALGGFGVEAREGIPKLIDMLREANAETRLASIDALVRIATAEKEAKVPIRAKTAFASLAFLGKVDNNPAVARAANMAMTRIGQPVGADVPDLLLVAGDKNQPLIYRASAAQVLTLIGTDAKDHVEAMCKLLSTDEPAVRVLIADALGALGPEGKAAIPPLLQALKKDDDVNVRVSVVQALGDIGQFHPKMVQQTLERIFADPMEAAAVHEAAAEALKKVQK
jgi:HEAT repeat protein